MKLEHVAVNVPDPLGFARWYVEHLKLIIELDGSQHLEQRDYDAERTKYLELRGYKVLRFWNHEVMNHIDEVLNVIWKVRREETRDPQR